MKTILKLVLFISVPLIWILPFLLMYLTGVKFHAFVYLKNDFTGFSFHATDFFIKIFQFCFVIYLFLLMYILGRVIEKAAFSGLYSQQLQVFVRFTLGYILLASVIFLLGFFSVLNQFTIILLFCAGTIVGLIECFRNPLIISVDKKIFQFSILKYISVLLIFIAFIRLLLPEVAPDPLDYHLRFPRIYVYNHSIMVPALGDESYITIPQLPEMLFIPSEMLTHGKISGAINFGFFLIIFLLLYRVNIVYKKERLVGPISALLFAINPWVFSVAYSAYSDYPALLCIILSGYVLIEGKLSKKSTIVSGILMGGALASKLWVVFYFPFYFLFLFLLLKREKLLTRMKALFIFCASAAIVVFPWYFRAFLLTGNPFYYNVNQGQINPQYSLTKLILSQLDPNYLIGSKFAINLPTIIAYIGIGLLLLAWHKIYRFGNRSYLLLFLLLLIPSLFLPTSFAVGRYALPYLVALYTVSAIAVAIYFHNAKFKVIVILIFFVVTSYYAFRALLVVPYGLGWANVDSYIHRSLITDDWAYYDFNHTFAKSINPNETVATYHMTELYYATFRYKNIYYFYNQQTHVLNIPTNQINKLLLRGGDFNWFCKTVGIINCKDYKVSVITKFSSGSYSELILYKIKREKTFLRSFSENPSYKIIKNNK